MAQPAPKQVSVLVDRFHRNIDAYRLAHYNETQLRREFIDPLFRIFGWDVDNEKGYSEAYMDASYAESVGRWRSLWTIEGTAIDSGF